MFSYHWFSHFHCHISAKLTSSLLVQGHLQGTPRLFCISKKHNQEIGSRASLSHFLAGPSAPSLRSLFSSLFLCIGSFQNPGTEISNYTVSSFLLLIGPQKVQPQNQTCKGKFGLLAFSYLCNPVRVQIVNVCGDALYLLGISF